MDFQQVQRAANPDREVISESTSMAVDDAGSDSGAYRRMPYARVFASSCALTDLVRSTEQQAVSKFCKIRVSYQDTAECRGALTVCGEQCQRNG